MSVYKTNKGKKIDMGKLALLHQTDIAAGNVNVNARGDVIQDGKVVKTSRERRNQFYSQNQTNTKVISTKTKDLIPNDLAKQAKEKKKPSPPKEKILPNGDIIIVQEDNTDYTVKGEIDGNSTTKR